MAVSTNQVFLVPGQRVTKDAGGNEHVSPAIEHCVVVAADDQAAQATLEVKQRNFRPLGFTSLAQYEEAVVKVRAALSGEVTEWPLVVADGMAG